MSTEIHQGPSQAALRDLPAFDEPFDHREDTKIESGITMAAAVITIVFVSFAAVLMAMR
jgi:hypothetical protein